MEIYLKVPGILAMVARFEVNDIIILKKVEREAINGLICKVLGKAAVHRRQKIAEF